MTTHPGHPRPARRSLSAALLAVLVLTLTLAPGTGLLTAARAAGSTETTFGDLLAGARADAGSGPLERRSDLADIARQHARDMAEREDVFHDPTLRDRVADWDLLGENVGSGTDARSLHEAFLSKDPYRSTMLDDDYTQVGIGAAVGADGRVYVTEIFRLPTPGSAADSPEAGSSTSTAPDDGGGTGAGGSPSAADPTAGTAGRQGADRSGADPLTPGAAAATTTSDSTTPGTASGTTSGTTTTPGAAPVLGEPPTDPLVQALAFAERMRALG